MNKLLSFLLQLSWWQRSALLALLLLTINLTIVTLWIMLTKPQPVQITTTQRVEPVETDIDLLAGTWTFIPGVSRSGDHLTVSPLNLTIAEQDGSAFHANPPINRIGTYLQSLTGDIELKAAIHLKDASSASLQLYGSLPLIADEFRVEGDSIWFTFSRDRVEVQVWSRAMVAPVSTNVFIYTPSDTLDVRYLKKGSNVEIVVNGVSVGSISAPHVFATKQLWFGLTASDKNWDLTKLALAKPLSGTVHVADASSLRISTPQPYPLQSAIAQKRSDFVIGTAVALGPLVSDSQYNSIVLDKNIFGSFTPENEMKMINLQPQQGVFNFTGADGLIHLANQNGITNIHGHTLVFGEANPKWVQDLPTGSSEEKAKVETVMKDHITQVVSHFGPKVTSWDVINEPLADYDQFEQGQMFRNHVWYRSMGKQFIIKALETAYTANPKALLFINEFGLEADGERWDSFLQILKELQPELESRGIPVSQIGIGFQTHIYDAEDKVNPSELQNHLRQLAHLGYVAQVSEIDVYSSDGAAIQANQYASVLGTCMREPNCKAYRTWIVSDRYNLYKDDGQVKFGIDGLFDKDMRPRPAFQKLLDTVK